MTIHKDLSVPFVQVLGRFIETIVGFVPEIWKPFASLILEASYEATICAGILNRDNRVYLSLVGGGVFGNDLEWICSAIQRAILKYIDYDLDVKIVNYKVISGDVLGMVKRFEVF